MFNKSSDILSCIPGFFDSPIHCLKHLEYLSGTSLVENIKSDFSQQFDLLKTVLAVWCRTEAFKMRMEAAELRCKDLHGSRIPLYVDLLRERSCIRIWEDSFALWKRSRTILTFFARCHGVWFSHGAEESADWHDSCQCNCLILPHHLHRPAEVSSEGGSSCYSPSKMAG